MATPVRERIIALVCTKLALITTANGYSYSIKKVLRDGEILLNTDEVPCLKVVDRGDSQKRHVKHAYENTLNLEIQAYVREHDKTVREAMLAGILADVQKVMSADDYWGGLVARTKLMVNSYSTSEASEPDGSTLLNVQLTYRVERNDPYTLVTF